MGQEVNTQRVLTIAGSVALLAITAYGVWKWNSHKDYSPTQRPTEEKKKSIAARQVVNDKEDMSKVLSEQSQHPIQQVVEVTEQKAVEVGGVQVEEALKEEALKEEAPKEEASKEEASNEKAKEVITEEIVTEELHVQESLVTEEEEYVVIEKQKNRSTIDESCNTSSTDETNDVWTPDHNNNTPLPTTTTYTEPVTEEYIWKPEVTTTSTVVETTPKSKPLSLYAPVFVPRNQQQQPPKKVKKRLSRAELIEQQRQNHTPHAKARCSHWPRCTNKNCKFWHPFRDCREGETCPFGNKCMFIHPSDYIEPPRVKKPVVSDSEDIVASTSTL